MSRIKLFINDKFKLLFLLRKNKQRVIFVTLRKHIKQILLKKNGELLNLPWYKKKNVHA